MVFSLEYNGDPRGPRATIRIMGGGEEILLSVVKLCGMEIPPNEALDTNGSLHLIIGYLLRTKCCRFGVIVPWLVS